jgi:hypothetical protein
MQTLFFRIVKHKYFLLIFLWSVLTVINVGKAFHIDDTFHLEASDYIRNNPGKPMSGLINWGDDPTPMYSHNNPPLFFYLIALFSSIFGTYEIPLHLLLSVFTFLGLYYFYKTAQILSLQNVNTLLVLFAFCPALLINQNLMLDIPVLAIIMGSAYFLIKANYSKKTIYYSLTALALTIGLLIKYSILPLFAVLILVILIRHDYKKLLVMLIPIFTLILWSYWNYIEYGSVHILSKSAGIIHIKQLWAFMACLGSISTFSISFIFGSYPKKIIKLGIYFILAIFVISVIIFFFGLIPELQFSKYLNLLFLTNGFMVFIALFIQLVFIILIKGLRVFLTRDDFVILLYIGSISAFMILFAPYIATRHVLLVIPFILLFGHELINKATIRLNRLSLTVTILLGLLLGISDWKYSDYYRQMASAVDLPRDRNIWTAGHWGWQWYSKINGMKQYNMNQSNVVDGDYFVYPGNISKQKINKNINLIVLKKEWEEASILTFFSGNDFASLYNSTMDKPAWCLSKDPIDTIFICKIKIVKKE